MKYKFTTQFNNGLTQATFKQLDDNLRKEKIKMANQIYIVQGDHQYFDSQIFGIYSQQQDAVKQIADLLTNHYSAVLNQIKQDHPAKYYTNNMELQGYYSGFRLLSGHLDENIHYSNRSVPKSFDSIEIYYDSTKKEAF